MKSYILLPSLILLQTFASACGSEAGEESEADSFVQGTCANADPTTNDVKTLAVIDRDPATSYSNGNGWQSATIDLGCSARVTGVRRYLRRVSGTSNRVGRGESVSVSKDGIAWTSLTGATTFGWATYVNYIPEAWHSMPYGWSKWLRPNKPTTARYIRFSWDEHNDALAEVEVSIRSITSSAQASNGTNVWDVLDGSATTGFRTASANWQYVTVDLGRPILVSRFRRQMSGTGTTRGNQGERLQLSSDGTTYRDLLNTEVLGWETYNNYAPEAWDGVPYGWTAWLRIRNPQPIRYVRFMWDGNNDALNEIEIDSMTDSGDTSYDFGPQDAAFWSSVQSSHPFAPSGPIQIPLSLDDLRRQVGFTGAYDGFIFKRNNIVGSSKVRAFLSLVDNGGDVRGTITVLGDGLGYDGGLICGTTDFPRGTQLQIRMQPWTYDGRFTAQLGGSYDASRDLRIARQGVTTREVGGLPVSGDVEVTTHAVLQTYLSRTHVVADVSIVTPSPCNDATLEVQFFRREDSLLAAYGY